MKVFNKTLTYTCIIIALLVTAFYFVVTYFSIKVSLDLSREDVHLLNGKPCGIAYYKDIQANNASFYEVWEKFGLIGHYRTYIHYDSDNKVVSKESHFQWLYEPEWKGLKRDKSSCLLSM